MGLSANDLMLVRRMNKSRRARLMAAGVTTMATFAAADLRPTSAARWTRCGPSCRTRPSFSVVWGTSTTRSTGWPTRSWPIRPCGHPEAQPRRHLLRLRGRPLWRDPATGEWGIEYLFGLVEQSWDGHDFSAFTAHSLEEERQALIDFVDHVNERRALYPELDVFHYAQYEVKSSSKPG